MRPYRKVCMTYAEMFIPKNILWSFKIKNKKREKHLRKNGKTLCKYAKQYGV